MKRNNVVTFEHKIVLPEEIIATDPCYKVGIWCQKTLSVKQGTYICKVEKFDDGTGWGTRNYILKLNHVSYPKKVANEYVTTLDVDSGQIGVFGVEYYKDNQPDEDWYRNICNITLEGSKCGVVDDKGIVTQSGCGDGGYPLKVGYNSKGEIVAIEINFL